MPIVVHLKSIAMKVRKFHSVGEPTEKVTMRVQIETQREQALLTAMFHNTYKLQEIANAAGNEVFTHAEVKAAADAFYIALVTNNH